MENKRRKGYRREKMKEGGRKLSRSLDQIDWLVCG